MRNTSFSVYVNPDRLSPPIRFNHRISGLVSRRGNDTATVKGVFQFRWPPGETKRPYKSFLSRKATHENEYEGLRKKIFHGLSGEHSTRCF